MPRHGMRAAVVDNVLYICGGDCDDIDGDALNAILSWNPLQEEWTHEGDLEVARSNHAVVAIPSTIIECATIR